MNQLMTRAFNAQLKVIEKTMSPLRGIKGETSIMGLVGAVLGIGVSIILAVLVMGKFSGVAQSTSFGLSDTWMTILNSTIDIMGTTISMASLLPFALIGTGLMGVIGYAWATR